MFYQVMRTELIKLRRAPVWIAFFALTALSAVMGTFNYLNNTGILTQQWYSLWTQHTLFAGFFFLPSLLGVLCAYLWRMEHCEHNWNALMSRPVPLWMIFGGKLAVAAALSFLTQAATGVFFLLSGLYAGFDAPLPPELPRWLLMGALGGIAVCSVQLLISMVVRSFAPPVAVALAGGVAGLAFVSAGLGMIQPYALLALGMDANGTGALAPEQWGAFFGSCAFFTSAPWVLATLWLRRRDVTTHA